MTKEDARLAVMGAISMALKDPSLQQCFEIICKENAELKENLKTAYRKGMRHMAKALKDYDRTDGAWTDYFEHTVDKVLQREQLDFEEYGTLADQLTKAKELLERFLGLGNLWDLDCKDYFPLRKEVEHFLSEVEK